MGHAVQAATPPVCTGDRFLVARDPGASALLASNTQREAIVVRLGSPAALEISEGCPPVSATLKATKRGAVLNTTWPAGNCTGEATVRLKVKIDGACAMTGVLKKRKHKPIRFSAAVSKCGDGVVDVGGHEQCEPGATCGDGQACRTDCRCPRASTTPRPVTTTTLGITTTTLVITTTTTPGATVTTTTTSTSTSTTQPSTGSCRASALPVCGGQCDPGLVCTEGTCASLSFCFADDDCASGFCILEFNLCAEDVSCSSDDECDTFCIHYSGCFCWPP